VRKNRLYNLLVVDDEPISTNGIADCLREYGSEDWNIQSAYSPQQALEIALDRVDILLTDITMPVIDGYELYHRITERWPRCKVIYLTGNLDLQFAQKAIRTKGVIDYILKTEKESIIIRAAKDAAEILDNEIKTIDFQKKLHEQVRSALPILRKEYLMNLLVSESIPWERKEKFSTLGISLDDEQEVFLMYGAIEAVKASDQKHFELVSMDAVMQMTLNDTFRWISIQLDVKHFISFVQFRDITATRSISGVFLPYMELVQESMEHIFINLSLILDKSQCKWEDVPEHYRLLAEEFDRKMSIPNAFFIYQGGNCPAKVPVLNVLTKINRLKAAIIERNEEDALFVLQDILLQDSDTFTVRLNSYTALINLFSSLFIAQEYVPDSLRLPPFENNPDSWIMVGRAFQQIIGLLINKKLPQDTEILIQKINQYVEDTLDKNISLTMAAEYFNFSPTYFSKLYKHITGESFIKYVLKRRLKRGKELLENEELKINDIAHIVGYWSPSYFICEFRKMYGITPAEYRKERR
jgi:two-component system response regulator YesN